MSGALAAIGQAALLTATISSSLESDSGSGVITLGPVSVTVAGGIPAYTYAWSFSSGGSGMTITSPTSSSTTITGNPPGTAQYTGTIICTVTDAGGRTKVSNGILHTMQGV